MTYDINHTTTYDYSAPVSVSHHILRLQPRARPGQSCLQNGFEIEPRPLLAETHADYFGNPITFVTVEGSHTRLVVTSRSRVQVHARVLPEPSETPAWENVRDLFREEQFDDVEACEFIYPSPLVNDQPEFAAYANPSFTPERPVLEAVLDLTRRIHVDFKFSPKSTTVATPLSQVMKTRRGVCQDFAQLEIAFLRAMGIPARYISGYLETLPPPGKARLVGADASHAWVSFFCPGVGWIDADPTNNSVPSDRHVTVAWGRDYSDVSPIRGVILGSGEHSLKVSVDVARHDAESQPADPSGL